MPEAERQLGHARDQRLDADVLVLQEAPVQLELVEATLGRARPGGAGLAGGQVGLASDQVDAGALDGPEQVGPLVALAAGGGGGGHVEGGLQVAAGAPPADQGRRGLRIRFPAPLGPSQEKAGAGPGEGNAGADEHGQPRQLAEQIQRPLNPAADRVAAALQRDGLEPGASLAICAAASIEYAAILIGGLRAGVALVPLAPSSTPASLAGMVEDSDARVFFVDADVLREIAPVKDRIQARLIGLADAPAGLAFEAWLAPHGSRPQAHAVAPQQVFNIIYSSGTTGTPKGIVHAHALRWNQIRRVQESGGYGPDAVTLISTPLYSNTTLVSLFPTLSLGGTVVLMRKFDAGQYLTLAARHRVTHTMLVPVQYQRLMARADFGDYDLSSYRMKFSTSAPLSAALKAEILKRWPGGLVEYYGMTEGGGSCVQTRLSAIRAQLCEHITG